MRRVPNSVLLAAALLAGYSGCKDGVKPYPYVDPDQVIVPGETADEAALSVLSGWRELPVFASGLYRMQSSEDRLTGEPPPVTLVDNGNRDMNNFICKSEDAELEEPALIPVTLDLEVCPEPYVKGFVMARFEGSGRLSRIWMTALSLGSGPPDREILRIYVDDEPVPVIQVPLAAALDGSAGEIFAPPFGAGAAGYLAWYYPVVFGSKLITTIDRLDPLDFYYHQTVVVLDPQPAPRAAAESRLDARDDAAAVLTGNSTDPSTPLTRDVSLPPGTPVSALDLAGPGAIHALSIRVSEDRVGDLSSVGVEVRWDNSNEPAIDVPLGDLFAASLAVPENTSLALSATRDGTDIVVELRLPMPFVSRSEWTLTNRGSSQLDLQVVARIHDDVPASDFGRLHVQRFETTGPTAESHHPLVSVSGPGRLVGVCLMLEGHEMESAGFSKSPFNFLEGDELGIIDGVRAVAGTGTEDYLNGSFYFDDGPAASPFAQWWGIETDDQATPPSGRVTACRWHVLGDAVDFQTSLQLDLEIGPGEPSLLDRYVSVAYLYL